MLPSDSGHAASRSDTELIERELDLGSDDVSLYITEFRQPTSPISQVDSDPPDSPIDSDINSFDELAAYLLENTNATSSKDVRPFPHESTGQSAQDEALQFPAIEAYDPEYPGLNEPAFRNTQTKQHSNDSDTGDVPTISASPIRRTPTDSGPRIMQNVRRNPRVNLLQVDEVSSTRRSLAEEKLWAKCFKGGSL